MRRAEILGRTGVAIRCQEHKAGNYSTGQQSKFTPTNDKTPPAEAGGALGLGNGYTAGMRAALLIVCLVAVGCTGEPVKNPPRKSLADRRADAQAALSKTPTPRTYRIDGNELKVIDIPVLDASGLAEVQRCFVWRDQEYRSSTLSCGQMPEILISRD